MQAVRQTRRVAHRSFFILESEMHLVDIFAFSMNPFLWSRRGQQIDVAEHQLDDVFDVFETFFAQVEIEGEETESTCTSPENQSPQLSTKPKIQSILTLDPPSTR